jgi:hypothetical protein
MHADGRVQPIVRAAFFYEVQIAQSVPVFQGEKLSLCLRRREFFNLTFPLMRSLLNKPRKDEKPLQAESMVPAILPIKKGHISCSFLEIVGAAVATGKSLEE